LNGYRVYGRLATSLIIVLALLLLSGCQGLTGNSNTAPGTVGIASTALNFGAVPVGSSKTMADTLTNSTSSAVTISAIQGVTSGFKVTGISVPLVLAAAQSVSFSVEFQPSGAGDPATTISFLGSNGQAYASLSAAADAVTLGKLSPTPATISFGNVKVGASQTSTVTLANGGGSDLVVSQATMSGAGFTLSNLSMPLTVSAGSSSSVKVTFAPPAAGNFTGSVTFSTASDQVTGSSVLSFSGAGVTSGDVSASPSSLAFGSVTVGNNQTVPVTVTNTGGTSVTLSSVTAGGSGFSVTGAATPLTLSAGQGTTFNAIFTPASAGAAVGTLTINSNASNPTLSVPLSGTGVATAGVLSANPTSLAFSSTQVGSHTSLSETVTNTGESTVAISQVNVTGAAFSASSLPTFPISLASGQSVTFNAIFTPTTSGTASGSLSVVSNASNPSLGVGLSGTGTATGTLAVSPASLSFGSVLDGSSSMLSGTLTASGASVSISSATLSNGEFALSGISLPATLAAGQSANFSVTFTPGASGAASASLSFLSNASNSPTTQSMSGTGTAPTQHTVDLSWNASTNAVGYNIYRSTTSGGPYTMINSSLDSTTAYADGTVVSGQTYYYVAAAVDSSSNESGYSNQAQAVIPTP
jgi:Abnormal spindle-like microcephaly-assoc'd, ASPM-SPD-2-Hydin